MIEYNNRECLQICDVHCGENSIDDLRAEVERLTGFINDSRDMVVIDRSSRCEAAEADAKDADRERKRCETSHAEVNIVLDKAIARAEKAERERDEARESFDKAASSYRGSSSVRSLKHRRVFGDAAREGVEERDDA